MELIADTTLLVGIGRSQPGARSFITQNPGKSLRIPWIVLGKFWHGTIRANQDQERVRRFLSLGLAFATTCIAFGKPLVTRNRRHFEKIEDLKPEVLAD